MSPWIFNVYTDSLNMLCTPVLHWSPKISTHFAVGNSLPIQRGCMNTLVLLIISKANEYLFFVCKDHLGETGLSLLVKLTSTINSCFIWTSNLLKDQK